MKKKIFCLIICMLFILTVSAASSSFTFNGSEVFYSTNRSNALALKFDQSYKISNEQEDENNDELKELVKKTTYYLLGPANNSNETSSNYIKRKNLFYDLRYAPDIPLDEKGELDSNSEEYKDDLYSGYLIPNIFTLFNDLEIIYNQINDVQIVTVDDGFYAKVTMSNVKMKIADEDNPINYKTISVDLDIYYYFKLYNNEYKLYYVYGEYSDEVEQYNNELSQQEYKGISSINTYNSSLSSLYDYSKLNKMSKSDINKIYNSNKSNVVMINAMNNQGISNSATGFFIDDSIVVTTWSFLEKALHNGTYLTMVDGNDKTLSLDGIVSIDVDNDYVVLKVSGSNAKGVQFGTKPEVESVAIMISSKTGLKLSINVGIVMSNDKEITNLISTTESEEGAPIFNDKGQVIGMNNSKITNAYFSEAYSIKTLSELQEKFKDMDISNISYIPFEELKENYYVTYGTDKVVNEIDKKVWNRYKKIGDLENTITLDLVKASYKDGILSLRYKNNLSSIFSNIQLATSFTSQLKQDGYNIVINNSAKQVYSNDKYRVTIMSEFDYLIIVIAEM